MTLTSSIDEDRKKLKAAVRRHAPAIDNEHDTKPYKFCEDLITLNLAKNSIWQGPNPDNILHQCGMRKYNNHRPLDLEAKLYDSF